MVGLVFNGCDKDDEVAAVLGCTDNGACNYDAGATEDDNSCEYASFPNDCDGCLDAMAVENYESFFHSGTIADIGCENYEPYYNQYNGNYYYWDDSCGAVFYLWNGGISLSEEIQVYYDYYTGEFVEYSQWQFTGQGDLAMWVVYYDAGGSLSGTYEAAPQGSDGYYYYAQSGTYVEDSGYAYNINLDASVNGPTAVFASGTLTVNDAPSGLYNISFNHEGDNGKPVLGCYDGLELVNYMESRMQDSDGNNWAKSFLAPKKFKK